MKRLNMDSSLTSFERKYQLLELEEYRFHAFESTILYKQKGNDAKVLVKFIPCLVIYFDTPHSGRKRSDTLFQSIFKRVFKLTRITHLLIIVYHPHASSLAEVTNHKLKLILGKMIDQSLRNWSIKLDEALRAFRTGFKTPNDQHFTSSTILL